MKTKEAIELVEDLRGYELNIERRGKENEIVELLKRGEKFEKMWREFSEYLSEEQNSLLKTNGTMIVIKVYKKWRELKQKYFPKEE